MTEPGWSVQRYQEIIAAAAATVDELRTRDRERADDLAEAVLAAQHDATEATRQEQRVHDLAEQRWQSATRALWNQRWLTMKPFPDPEHGTTAELPGLEAEIDRAHQSLVDNVNRQGLLRIRKRP